MTYKIITIDSSDSLEQLGTKEKFWCYDKNNTEHLFKIGRPNTGENWSEKVAGELAKLLGISAIYYEFAIYNNKEGVLSQNFVPDNGRLIHGNELMAKIDKHYPKLQRYSVKSYCLNTVMALLKNLQQSNKQMMLELPIGFKDAKIKEPIELFIGYLLFDCWIANGDRHHENWGIIIINQPDLVTLHLSPSYDHASSLGCRESDKKREERINTKDKGYSVASYVRKAKSAFYDNKGKHLKTIDAFTQGIGVHYKDAALIWLERLEKITLQDIDRVFSEIPLQLISKQAILFAKEILEENKKRLLEVKERL
jgi:hypothetical protein